MVQRIISILMAVVMIAALPAATGQEPRALATDGHQVAVGDGAAEECSSDDPNVCKLMRMGENEPFAFTPIDWDVAAGHGTVYECSAEHLDVCELMHVEEGD